MSQRFWTLVDRDGHLIDVDEQFCALLDRPKRSLVRQNILSITHPNDQFDTRADFSRLQAKESRFTITKRYVHARGHAIWAHATAIRSEITNGRIFVTGAILLADPDVRLAAERLKTTAIFSALELLSKIPIS